MTAEERKAILSIALHAAYADGLKHEHERKAIRSIAQSQAKDAGLDELAPLYQDVLLNRVPLATTAAVLTGQGMRHLAYETAVYVCDADGRQTEPERRFLAELKALLQLDPGDAVAIEREADAMFDLSGSAAPAPADDGLAISPSPATTQNGKVPEGELDKSILNSALVNGALELLPQSWASMAIIPLQIRMVYNIGKAHGVALDQGHIKEFIAAAGVGLTSQYLEQFARKLLGGLIGKAAGKTAGKLGSTATGVAASFATTYALGQLSKRYYGGGRKMNAAMLRETFQSLMQPARQLQNQYLPQIRQQAETLDMGRVMSLVKGA